ncbi:MAG: BlaI/MecI/CopY family transcriptional regulator [Acidobacteriota bacterium]
MGRPPRSGPPKLLTDVELELMSLLWKLGEARVRELIEALPAGRDLAYTSVSTVVRILETKGMVGSRKDGRAHVYRPLVSKQEYEGRSVDHLVDKVFDGTPTALVQRLLEHDGLSRDELEEIRRVLEDKLK